MSASVSKLFTNSNQVCASLRCMMLSAYTVLAVVACYGLQTTDCGLSRKNTFNSEVTMEFWYCEREIHSIYSENYE
ncbi:hypothetical protein J6590_025310 [Homalodisca vitripennis]|nr:hypothetical protein J6590_025310 [Homalodisca vitripennis]